MGYRTQDSTPGPKGHVADLDAIGEEEVSDLAAAIKQARSTANLTQQQVADALGTSQGNIARLESGHHLPSTRNLQRVARATGTRLLITFERLPMPTAASSPHLPGVSEVPPVTRDLRNPIELMNYLSSRRSLLASAAGLAVGASTMHQRVSAKQATPAASPAASREGYKVITTPLGTYEIPLNPQRVVTIDSRLDLEPAIALELPVIATSYDHPNPWVPTDPDLPLLASPVDIEEVAALAPDLIVCVNLDTELWPAPVLNQIAPVVTTEFEMHWRDNLTQISEWLGTTERLQNALDEYDGLVAEVQEKHAEKLASRQIVYLQFFPDEASVRYNPDWALQATVIEDLGGTLFNGPQSQEAALLSTEQLGDLAEADGFLVQDFEGAALSDLENDPIWQTLPAVQAGAVVGTNGNTNFGSIYTAQELIRRFDELYDKIS